MEAACAGSERGGAASQAPLLHLLQWRPYVSAAQAEALAHPLPCDAMSPPPRVLFSSDQSFPLAGTFIYSVYQFQQKRVKRDPEGPFFLNNPLVGAVLSTLCCLAVACGVMTVRAARLLARVRPWFNPRLCSACSLQAVPCCGQMFSWREPLSDPACPVQLKQRTQTPNAARSWPTPQLKQRTQTTNTPRSWPTRCRSSWASPRARWARSSPLS